MLTMNKKGSIFLLTLTCMTVLFILGFSITFFTGSEDHSSAMSYESEVAFNLAEAAIEEFVARLKNSLNNDDPTNQLYRDLRAHDTDVTKEIPLKASQVARLTAYTREMARQIYGIQFGRGLVDSKDFVVDASLKLQHLNAVEATNGDQVLYRIKKDNKEKQGELEVRAVVNYRGHTAKVSLKFLIRVVKTFVPPFNFFTLYVKNASYFNTDDDMGGRLEPSKFNVYESSLGFQKPTLRLDNGWSAISHYKNTGGFDPTKNPNQWEEELGRMGNVAMTPPGRVYLGNSSKNFQYGEGIIVRPTNGAKILFSRELNLNETNQINSNEGFYQIPDMKWTGLSDFVNHNLDIQFPGVKKRAVSKDFNTGHNDTKIRIFNLGAGQELLGGQQARGDPSFFNCFYTYKCYTDKIVQANEDLKYRFADMSLSGLDVFGSAPPTGVPDPAGAADFSKLSPTIVYGPVYRETFRAVQIKPEGGEAFEMPFIGPQIPKEFNIEDDQEITATQAVMLLAMSGLTEGITAETKEYVDRVFRNWDKLPKQLKKLKNYFNFMSTEAVEPYNRGLLNFLNRLRSVDKYEEYTGHLAGYMSGFMENDPNNSFLQSAEPGFIGNSPMREYYEGLMWHALPFPSSSYLLDFYFIPRSTEDFFRGRTTIAVGGNSYDRFEFKYINNVQAYRSGANNQTLELNGILALNDSEPLGLRNLKFRGHGIIYSSPMMGGGKVVISGNLLGKDTDENIIHSSIGNDLLTIIAPQIVIDTTAAPGNRCYIEANLISVSEPLIVIGDKPVTIKGTVVTPSLNLLRDFQNQRNLRDPQENVIIYNALNGIWRNDPSVLLDRLYIAKIVTGGVGKFDWKYER